MSSDLLEIRAFFMEESTLAFSFCKLINQVCNIFIAKWYSDEPLLRSSNSDIPSGLFTTIIKEIKSHVLSNVGFIFSNSKFLKI